MIRIGHRNYPETRAGLQAALDENPGEIIAIPPNTPITFDGTPLSLTPAHNNTCLYVPPSSPFRPVQDATNYNMIEVRGTPGATTGINAAVRGSRRLTVVDSSSFAVGDEVVAALSLTNTWLRSTIVAIPDSTHIDLAEPACFSSVGGTLTKVNPVTGLRLDINGDGAGNMGSGTSLLDSLSTSHCRFNIAARNFGGSAHRHVSGYMDDLDEQIEESGNDPGVGDYGDLYSLWSTSCRYRIQSRRSQGFGPYLSHCHFTSFSMFSVNGTSRGLKWSLTCGRGNAQAYGSGETGLALADFCHDLTMEIDSRYNNGYGYWHESAGGDHQDRIHVWGTSRGNGLPHGENDALTGIGDRGCEIHLNADAVVSDNAGAIRRGP